MNDISQYFSFDVSGAQLMHYYMYLAFAALISFILVLKSTSKYKIELFFLCFYLISGNINDLGVIVIPGFSLFEIQPKRFIYLMLLFFLIRKLVRSKGKFEFDLKLPWFQIALYAYIALQIVSIFVNAFPAELKTALDAVAFLIIVIGIKLIADKPSYDLIGRAIIVCAVISSIVAIIQIGIDPYFLRIGDNRIAFGQILRANGIFSAEYYNSYLAIIAVAWTLTTIQKNWLKISLIFLFSISVFVTFHRMSWVILTLVFLTYFLYIEKVSIQKLMVLGMLGITLLLALTIFFYKDIVNSTLVKERISDTSGGRDQYRALVLDNIGNSPIFGYGNFEHDFFYRRMLEITSSRDRADGKTGGIHNGYLESLFLYGIPASICFTLFALFSVFYYATRPFKEELYFVIPFFVSVIYLIANLTNSFLFLTYLSLLLAMHIGIGMGLNEIKKEKSLAEAKS